MIKIALVGFGKMGLSHCSIINAHPDVDLVGVCDTSTYILDVLAKYTSIRTFTDYETMLAETKPDAVIVATPSSAHAEMVRTSLERDLSVFCEKPFTLSAQDAGALSSLAAQRSLVTQVGYHNRFVATFGEVKRLLNEQAIGDITHVLAEAYGPVVLKAKGSTWRSQASEGGGCLYDYAAHIIDLVIWYMGEPRGVGGTVLNSVFSREIDDEVSSTMYYSAGRTAQISANWCDESQRKMTTHITLWGTHGRIFVDRQECQVYLRDTKRPPPGYTHGWNVRYTTELTDPVWFYLRGEEYSAQLDHFVQRVSHKRTEGVNVFESAAVTDKVIAMMVDDSRSPSQRAPVPPSDQRRRSRWRLHISRLGVLRARS